MVSLSIFQENVAFDGSHFKDLDKYVVNLRSHPTELWDSIVELPLLNFTDPSPLCSRVQFLHTFYESSQLNSGIQLLCYFSELSSSCCITSVNSHQVVVLPQ